MDDKEDSRSKLNQSHTQFFTLAQWPKLGFVLRWFNVLPLLTIQYFRYNVKILKEEFWQSSLVAVHIFYFMPMRLLSYEVCIRLVFRASKRHLFILGWHSSLKNNLDHEEKYKGKERKVGSISIEMPIIWGANVARRILIVVPTSQAINKCYNEK